MFRKMSVKEAFFDSKKINNLLILEKNGTLYMTFDRFSKVPEKRTWYELSLNPLKEDSYLLVEMEKPIVDPNGYTYALANKFRFCIQNTSSKAVTIKNLMIMDDLYFNADLAYNTINVANKYGVQASTIYKIKNTIVDQQDKLIRSLFAAFKDNYNTENLILYYQNWIPMVIIINSFFTSNEKIRTRIIDYLVSNNLTTVSKLRLWIGSRNFREISNGLKVYSSYAVNGTPTLYRVEDCFSELYKIVDNADPFDYLKCLCNHKSKDDKSTLVYDEKNKCYKCIICGEKFISTEDFKKSIVSIGTKPFFGTKPFLN